MDAVCPQCQQLHLRLPLLHRDGDHHRIRPPRHHRQVSSRHHAAAAAGHPGVHGQRLHGEPERGNHGQKGLSMSSKYDQIGIIYAL